VRGGRPVFVVRVQPLGPYSTHATVALRVRYFLALVAAQMYWLSREMVNDGSISLALVAAQMYWLSREMVNDGSISLGL
jgi:hypothetical protein